MAQHCALGVPRGAGGVGEDAALVESDVVEP